MTKNNNIFNYVIYFLLFFTFNHFFSKYTTKFEMDEERKNYKLIEKYLLNDSSLANSKKPIIWIHNAYERNSKKWNDFSSRGGENLNEPYKTLCIKSIIKKCGKSFNVCLINDKSFNKLIPGWSTELSKIASPIKENIRKLACYKLLYHYGGILVPNSFFCFNDLNNVFKNMNKDNYCFSFEKKCKHAFSENKLCANSYFIGSSKNNKVIDDLIRYQEIKSSSDHSFESNFKGGIEDEVMKHITNNKMKLLSGKLIGIKDNDEKFISIDQLLSEDYININETILGIYIPSDELNSRTKINWFTRMSIEQILESDMIISKHMLYHN